MSFKIKKLKDRSKAWFISFGQFLRLQVDYRPLGDKEAQLKALKEDVDYFKRSRFLRLFNPWHEDDVDEIEKDYIRLISNNYEK